jgi:hypothetical protein
MIVDGELHHFGAPGSIDAIVLPLERDAVVVERNKAAVGDGDAVRVARQIAQYRFGSAEGLTLRVDDPFGLAQRRQMSREVSRLASST